MTKHEQQYIYNKNNTPRKRLLLTAALLSALLSHSAGYAENPGMYGPFDFHEGDGYGPYDYTNPKHVREKLGLVEKWHFSANVENLVVGDTSVYPFDDIYYTLRKFPNHHRALNSLGSLWRKYRAMKQFPPGTNPTQPAEYFFERAIAWSPNDATAKMLYGIHLHMTGKLDEALTWYKEAEKLRPNMEELNYNMGLLYLARDDLDMASKYAKKAYRKDYPLQGLKNKLIQANAWKE